MAITAKPTGYTVNTGHAKCPDHLWMIDEGSGTSLVDKGKGTGLNMTLDNADMWGTDGGGMGAIITCNDTGPRRATSSTGTLPSTSIVLVIYAKTTSAASNGNETPFSTGNSGVSNQNMTFLRAQGDEALDACHFDGTNSIVRDSGTNVYSQTWRMMAMKAKASGCAVSVDGGAWSESTTSSSFPNASGTAPNRFAIGVQADSTPGNYFNGSILAAFAYDNLYATADDAWIADLYSSPWQFLNTSSVAVLAHYYNSLRTP